MFFYLSLKRNKWEMCVFSDCFVTMFTCRLKLVTYSRCHRDAAADLGKGQKIECYLNLC